MAKLRCRCWSVVYGATLVLAVGSAGLIGCAARSDSGDAAESVATDLDQYPRPKLQSVSLEEAQRVVEDYVKGMTSHDYDSVRELFDFRALLQQVCYGVDPNAKVVKDFSQGFLKSVANLPERMGKQLEATPLADIIRVREADGAHVALIRFYGSETELIYQEITIARGTRNQPAIVDAMALAVGEPTTATMRRFFLAALASDSRGLLQRLTKQDNVLIKNLGMIQEYNRAQKQQDLLTVVNTYDAFPSELQRIKIFAVAAITAAVELDDTKRYERLMSQYRQWYPDDPSLNLLLIDFYAVKNMPKEMLATIDRLDEAVGGDPFLNLLRAQVSLGEENWKEARELATKVIEQVPDAEYSYWTVFDAAFAERDFDMAVEMLKVLHDKFRVDVRNLEKGKDYKALTESKPYRAWIEQQSSSTKEE